MNGETLVSRGERNHNPGNLRYVASIPWEGLAAPPSDGGGYCIFADDLHGLRALCRDLYSKWNRGLRTVDAIIDIYAPPNENDTAAYKADLCQRLNVKGDDILDLTVVGNLVGFARGIIIHENGRCIYSPETIIAAANLALPDTTS